MDFLIELVNAIGQRENPILFMLALIALIVVGVWAYTTIKGAGKSKEAKDEPDDDKPTQEKRTSEMQLASAIIIIAEELKASNGHNAQQLDTLQSEIASSRKVSEALVDALGSLKSGVIESIVSAQTNNIRDHDNNEHDRFKETLKKIGNVEVLVTTLKTFVEEKIYAAIEGANTREELVLAAASIEEVHTTVEAISVQVQSQLNEGESNGTATNSQITAGEPVIANPSGV
jgi:hypothetical protein